MKVSTEIDNNFGYEKITQLVDNIPLSKYLYLYDCLLPFIREENELNLRNQTEFRNPFTRLQLFANSFFPSTIKSWNKLSPQLRNAPTLNRFKQANENHTIKPPKFYIAGCRILNIIHTRLRHRSSSFEC